ncbi:MAG TPA: efflux RND transporter periplasmic adaptor subunit [Peptococcaceae bacterium]|nr:efflux RND transporter periplasmic adaptor subunit [Peptococcaceae bacterium]
MGLKDRFSKFKAMSRKKKIITVVVGVLILLFLGVRIFGSGSGNVPVDVQQSYIAVNAQTVQKGDISTSITLSGKVQADKEAAVLAKTAGRVQSIAVKVGDMVEKDQVLFSLDKTDMQAAYEQALAGYQLAEAAYEMNLEKYNKAVQDYENAKKLYEIGAISKNDLDLAEMQASDAVLRTSEAQFAQAKAQFESVSRSYADLDVKSPIAGIVTALNVKIGDMVTNAAPAATVVDMKKVFVTVSVSEKVINLLKNNQEALVEIASAGKSVKGQIESLSLAADARTGKYDLKVYIDNEDGLIKPGMFAKVTIATETKNDVIVIPTEAIIFHNGRDVVYVVNGNKVEEREVTVGLENGKQSEILSGLSAGEVIVIKGMNFVSDGSEIKIIELDGSQKAEGSQAEGGTEK